MTPQKIAGIVLVVLAIAVGGYFTLTPVKNPQADMSAVKTATTGDMTAQAVNSEPAAGDEKAQPEMQAQEAAGETGAEAAPAQEAQPQAEATVKTATDAEKVMAPQAMGDENAPVTIDEYASLTCPHCAHFYNETFDKIKQNYIDTGKVRFIYHDFPLNTPARDAALIAHCLPQDRYFKFVDFLFESQSKWAYESDYITPLVQNAKLLGASQEQLEACLNNEDMKRAIAEEMQEAARDHQVESTPTFIINGETVRGAVPYETFQEKIDPLLKKDGGAVE